MHIRMYGQRFEIVSDPFDEDDCVAVRATSANDPLVRTLRLPTAILVGPPHRFPSRQANRAVGHTILAGVDEGPSEMTEP
jgi:hypothetical protein